MVVGVEGGDAFFGDITGLAQGLCAVQVDLRAAEGGLAGRNLGCASGDQAGLLGEFALGLHALGFAHGQGGVGAVDGEVEVVAFELDQQLAFFHVFVVAHQHLDDARAKLAGDAGDLALDVGVVGAFIKAALEKPLGEKTRGNQDHDKQEDKQAAFERGGHGDHVGNKR